MESKSLYAACSSSGVGRDLFLRVQECGSVAALELGSGVGFFNSSGSFATLAAILRASSPVESVKFTWPIAYDKRIVFRRGTGGCHVKVRATASGGFNGAT